MVNGVDCLLQPWQGRHQDQHFWHPFDWRVKIAWRNVETQKEHNSSCIFHIARSTRLYFVSIPPVHRSCHSRRPVPWGFRILCFLPYTMFASWIYDYSRQGRKCVECVQGVWWHCVGHLLPHLDKGWILSELLNCNTEVYVEVTLLRGGGTSGSWVQGNFVFRTCSFVALSYCTHIHRESTEYSGSNLFLKRNLNLSRWARRTKCLGIWPLWASTVWWRRLYVFNKVDMRKAWRLFIFLS